MITFDAPSPTGSWWLRAAFGAFLGALLLVAVGALVLRAPAPLTPPATGVRWPDAWPERAPPETLTARVLTRCETRVPGHWLAQGLGSEPRAIAARVVVVEHPRGVVQFGTGPSCSGTGTRRTCALPRRLRALEPRPSCAPLPDLAETTHAIAPTLRTWHTGGLDDIPQRATWIVSPTELRGARWGAWPSRFALDRGAAERLAERAGGETWIRAEGFGRGRVVDVFGDGSVLVVAMRGSSWEELALWVHPPGRAPTLYVADAIWLAEQLNPVRARAWWTTFALDRNRMQLLQTQRELAALQASGVRVVPLWDAGVAGDI